MAASLSLTLLATTGSDPILEKQISILLERSERNYELQRDISSRLAALEKEQEAREINISNFYKNLWEPLTKRVNSNSDKIEEINKMISKQTAELAMIGAAGSIFVSVVASLLTTFVTRRSGRKRSRQ